MGNFRSIMAPFILWILLCHLVSAAGAGGRRTRSLVAGAGTRGPSKVDWASVYALDPYGSSASATGVNSLPISSGRDPVLDAGPTKAPQQPTLLNLTPFGVTPSDPAPLPTWQRGFGLEPTIFRGIPVPHSLGVGSISGGAGAVSYTHLTLPTSYSV